MMPSLSMATVLSINSTLPFSSASCLGFSHSSCFSCIFCRQSRGMPSSPSRDRFLMRCSQISGGHWTQTMPKRSTMSFIFTRWSQNWRQMACSAGSRMSMSLMMLAKMQRSESRDRSEILTPLPVMRLYSVHLFTRLMKAQIWKVKPHRAGFWQQRPSRLMFLASPTFCHSVSGSSRMASSGKFSRMIFRIVDFPLPMLPSMEMKSGLLLFCFGGMDNIKFNYTANNSNRSQQGATGREGKGGVGEGAGWGERGGGGVWGSGGRRRGCEHFGLGWEASGVVWLITASVDESVALKFLTSLRVTL